MEAATNVNIFAPSISTLRAKCRGVENILVVLFKTIKIEYRSQHKCNSKQRDRLTSNFLDQAINCMICITFNAESKNNSLKNICLRIQIHKFQKLKKRQKFEKILRSEWLQIICYIFNTLLLHKYYKIFKFITQSIKVAHKCAYNNDIIFILVVFFSYFVDLGLKK